MIIGVLIQKDAFFREYLSALSADEAMFRFFLDPRTDRLSGRAIHLTVDRDSSFRALLELMVLEYADRNEDSQAVLKPMAMTLLMHVARQHRRSVAEPAGLSLSEQIIRYIGSHVDDVTLGMIAAHFSYHPNYNFSASSPGDGKDILRHPAGAADGPGSRAAESNDPVHRGCGPHGGIWQHQ